MKRVRAVIEHEWSHRRWVWLCVASVAAIVVWIARPIETAPIDSYARCAAAGNPITQTDPPVCVIGAEHFVGPASSPTATAPPTNAQPFDLLVAGDSRGAYPRRQEAITSQGAWEQYWRTVHASISPLPPLLPVDFTTSEVLAVSQGRQPNGGYDVKITNIMTSATGTVVDVVETSPAATCHAPAVPTDPYMIVRTIKLPEPVIFRLTTQKRSC